MHRRDVALSVFILWAMSMPAQGQDAQSILQTAEELRMQRLDGVASYSVDATVMGQRRVTLYERTPVTVGGETVDVFRQVSPMEIRQRQGGEAQSLTPEQLEAFASAQEQTGDALGTEMERGMEQAGLPKGLLGAVSAGSADEPWASPDPRIMMGANARFLRGAAAGQRANAAEAAVADTNNGLADFASRAMLVGAEKVDGISAYHLRALDLDHRQALEDGGELVIDTISLWIDEKMYVPLKLTMEGTMSAQGQTRAVRIQKLVSDYREVAGSSMYEPYRQVMSMRGVMSDKDEKEMQKAQAELAKFEQQMAAMPESQRAMMEKMMGPQLEMVRNMAASGNMEVVTEVNAIIVNTGSSE